MGVLAYKPVSRRAAGDGAPGGSESTFPKRM